MKPILLSQNNERGSIILAVLMLLLALSVLGIAAIITTTTEVQISGNYRLQNCFFYGSDGLRRRSNDVAPTMLSGGAAPPEVKDPNLLNELLGLPGFGSGDMPNVDPDLSMDIGCSNVRVDIDRLAVRSAGGSATQFASGYEGIGMSAASGGTVITYQVDSIAGLEISESQTSHVYNFKIQ